jgi:hypothetical protein
MERERETQPDWQADPDTPPSISRSLWTGRLANNNNKARRAIVRGRASNLRAGAPAFFRADTAAAAAAAAAGRARSPAGLLLLRDPTRDQGLPHRPGAVRHRPLGRRRRRPGGVGRLGLGLGGRGVGGPARVVRARVVGFVGGGGRGGDGGLPEGVAVLAVRVWEREKER